MGKKKILIIDDSENSIKIAKDCLENTGKYTVITQQSGQAAFMTAKNNLPDLILLDIVMPDFDGLEILKLLKQDNSTKEIPVVMLTALRSTQTIKQALQLNAYDFMVKPVECESLIKMLENTLKS